MADAQMNNAMQKYRTTCYTLTNVYKTWESNRIKAISALEAIVVEMDSSEFTDNVTQIVGSSVSVAGALSILGGIVLIPFTGGVSAVITAGGIIAGVAGGIASLTSDKINQNYALRKMQEAANIILKDQKLSTELENANTEVEKVIIAMLDTAKDSGTDMSVYLKTASSTDKGLKIYKIAEKTVKGFRHGARGVAAGAKAVSKVVGKMTVGLAVVGIGFDIWSIVANSQDIAEGSKSEAGRKITAHIKDLKDSLRQIQASFSSVM
ncbi:apolipoprotein L3-like [Mytilus edulis]|uniref:apolipoprotein L3-like n=1 Tax=Mytilus edulis TaxID=6550 RepID=UPI0039EFB560